MERITSKVTRVLVITLLSAATLATAGSLTLKASTGVMPQAGTPIPHPPVCDLAKLLREQNKAFAEQQVQCNLELEARGLWLASHYPWAALLRNQRPEGPARRGFDIGMAAAEGQTEQGPGKQGIRASLNPTEQLGFDVAVSNSLDRNKNPDWYRNADLAREADRPRGDVPDAQPRYSEPELPVRRGSDSRSLRATLEHLRQGKAFLEIATPDQDGHLYKAIDNINNAIEELEKALRGRN